MKIEELITDTELLERARGILRFFETDVESLPTFINRFNVAKALQETVSYKVGDLIKEYAKAVIDGDDHLALDHFEDVIVANGVGKVFTDYINEQIRPGAIKEEKAREDARLAAMTPAQREQYKKAKENPFLRMMGQDPADAVGEPGAGGSFDA